MLSSHINQFDVLTDLISQVRRKKRRVYSVIDVTGTEKTITLVCAWKEGMCIHAHAAQAKKTRRWSEWRAKCILRSVGPLYPAMTEEKRKASGEIELLMLRKSKEELYGISGRELAGQKLKGKQDLTKWNKGKKEGWKRREKQVCASFSNKSEDDETSVGLVYGRGKRRLNLGTWTTWLTLKCFLGMCVSRKFSIYLCV